MLSGTLIPLVERLINISDILIVNDQFTGVIPPELGTFENMSMWWMLGNNVIENVPFTTSNMISLGVFTYLRYSISSPPIWSDSEISSTFTVGLNKY